MANAKATQDRHEKFCREYVIDYNGTQAAIRAGYSPNSARQQAVRLLSNANILARVRELQGEACKRLALTEDRIIMELFGLFEKCCYPVPVMVWDSGAGEKVESGEYSFDSKGALRAMELIGKHLGMFVERREVSVQSNGQLESLLEDRRRRRESGD